METLIRILHLEDDPADAELVQAGLAEAGLACRIALVQTRDEFGTALCADGTDIILADYRLPMYDGMSALRLTLERCPDIPFIFVSGIMCEETAIEALTQGATDYVLKQNLSRLASAVKRALQEARNRRERSQAEEALRESERQKKLILNSTAEMVTYYDTDLRVVWANRASTESLGMSPEDMVGLHCYEMWHQRGEPCADCPVLKAHEDKTPAQYEMQTPLGKHWLVRSYPVLDENNRVTALVGFVQDITERKRAEIRLRQSEHYKTIQNQIAKILLTIPDKEMYGEVLAVMLHALKSKFGLFGFIEANGDLVIPSITRGIWNECQVPEKSAVYPRDTWGASLWGRSITEKRAFYSDGPFHTPEGHIPIEHFLAVPIIFGNETIGLISVANNERGYTEDDRELLESIAGYISPILNARLQRDRQERERKEAEEERKKMQEQFFQAQKMESVGRLAGGVAHDFNNMLNVILGYADMALNRTDRTHQLFDPLQQICRAAERSADLTRQLLAFARRQAITPKVLDLNDTVGSMLKLLRRLIGEDIGLAWMPGVELWAVKVDPSQIDQILANLCVNARDAIAGVGKVTIKTINAVFDETYCVHHADASPGEYVLLAVSDNGCGMDRDTKDKIFEPFFTTKESGKGTGLGLATVYGIVRQNNGFINVYSEPGHGTTFRICLPRHAAGTGQMRKEIPAVPTALGDDTVLLAEDESSMLVMVKLMLESLGYRVLAAPTPGEAVRIAMEHCGRIHLLITDLVMPEMTGRDLSEKLNALCPGLRCLYMSGYTDDIIAHQGMLDEGVNFIQKPFSKQALAARVREVLDSK